MPSGKTRKLLNTHQPTGGTKWVKGQPSANPGGRPKEFREFKLLCQQLVPKHIGALEKALANGEAWAWQLTTGYAYGQPTKHVAVATDPTDPSSLTDAELARIALGGGEGDDQAPGDPLGPDDLVH